MKIDVVGIRLVKEREIDYDKSIHQPIDTVNFVLEEMQDLDREMCMTLNLDANNCVLNAHVVSVGGLDRAVVDVKNIMKSALLSNAHGIIMYHNHPSGNSTPSQADFFNYRKNKESLRDNGYSIFRSYSYWKRKLSFDDWWIYKSV